MTTIRTLAIRFVLLAFLALALLPSCNNDHSRNDAGNSANADDEPADDDSGEAVPLLAAAGNAVLSPTAQNHPETIYLGGIIPSRVGTGVHDDLSANALALKQGDRSVVLVSLDFLGFSRSRIREIQDRLSEQGLNPDNVLISSTHTHEAPDTLGVFGPDVLHSGVSREFIVFAQDTITNLIVDVWSKLAPVTMKAAMATVDDPGSNYPTLMADLREPETTADWIAAAQFIGLDGATVATLVNWHAHPEVMIESTLVSADFPGYLRERVRDRLGGECVYISGALGGLATPTGVDVPARDENGEPVLDNGRQKYLRDGTWDKARSLGMTIADLAIDALGKAEPAESPALHARVEELLLPVTSPTFILAYLTHLIEFDSQDLVADRPEICGWFGCSSDRLGLVRVGPVEIITSPGETFPETLISRNGSDYDFGDPWGVTHFRAMTGVLDAMTAPVPMLISVCGNEIGYLIPVGDYHAYGHPDHYEEDLTFDRGTESLYRHAATQILTAN